MQVYVSSKTTNLRSRNVSYFQQSGMNGIEILKKLKELEPVLQRDFSVSKIGMFGSFAGNRFSEASDIDLLVEFRNPIGWRFFTLEIFLEKIFERKIDLVTPEGLRDRMKKQILDQVIYP